MKIQLFSNSEKKNKNVNSSHEKKNPNPQESTNSNSLLIQDLDIAKKDIDTLLLHLDYQTDPDMIDCYTYQLKGAYMRYKFLLRKIQQTEQVKASL